jgi:hypothetical protein
LVVFIAFPTVTVLPVSARFVSVSMTKPKLTFLSRATLLTRE